MHLNFAGGGHQVDISGTGFPIDQAEGHITVRKDEAGIVTISACSLEEMRDQAARSGKEQCAAPAYQSCEDCLSNNKTYACWCSSSSGNIYGSGACQNGGNCQWTLVSDIWNGVSGDAGYYGCMNGVPGAVDAQKPNLNSDCAFSLTNILLRGGGANESLNWGSGSPESCDVLTTRKG